MCSSGLGEPRRSTKGLVIGEQRRSTKGLVIGEQRRSAKGLVIGEQCRSAKGLVIYPYGRAPVAYAFNPDEAFLRPLRHGGWALL